MLAIDFFAISDAKDQNYQTIVFNFADEAVVAHAIFPKLSKPRAVKVDQGEGEPGEGRRGLVGSLTHKRLSVKQNPPGRVELLQEIKIKNIAGQHRAAVLSACDE